MNAEQIINKSFISQLDISDGDKSMDGSKTFSDIKRAIAKAINTIDQALPGMKAAGVDMKKAAGDAEGLFRNIVRKGWSGNEVEFYITRNGNKAITEINQRHLDDIVTQIENLVANY